MIHRIRTLLAAAPLLLLTSPALGLELDLIEGEDNPVSELSGALLGASSEIQIVPESEQFVGRVGDGQDPDLAQSATYTGLALEHAQGGETISNVDGIFLTSGNANIPFSNTLPSSESPFDAVTETGNDPEIEAILEAAESPSTVTNDVNSFRFDFVVEEGRNAVRASFVFGSEEYPTEGVTDVFVFIVDGVNYARFPDGGLVNFAIGQNEEYFNDNDDPPVYPIEYNGISDRLTICAPLDPQRETHTLKIAVADTSDSVYDSGVFLGGLRAGTVTDWETCGFVEPALPLYEVSDWGEAIDVYTGWYEDVEHTIGFFAAQTAGVHILDLTDPGNVELLGVYQPESCDAEGVAAVFFADEVTFVESQQALHVSAGACGVQIVDVSNPTDPAFEPTLVAAYDTPLWAEGVAVHTRGGDSGATFAYVADFDSLEIWDVSDPANPVHEGSIGIGEDPEVSLGEGPVINVTILDEGDDLLALVATGDGMRVVNVEDPQAPWVRGIYLSDTNIPYHTSQDIAFDPSRGQGGVVLLPIWAAGLSAIDLADLGAPSEIDTEQTQVAYYTAVPFGGRIYATEGTEGLSVLDLVDESYWDKQASIPVGEEKGEVWAWDVKVQDCIAYVTFGNLETGEGGLQISPLSDCGDENPPEPPVIIAGDDSDQDGVVDAEDNCLEAANADQADANLDGFGDACDADYDDNGMVGLSDFGAFSAGFGAGAGDPAYRPVLDHDGNGAIGISDYLVFSGQFGGPPGPSGLACAGRVPCP